MGRGRRGGGGGGASSSSSSSSTVSDGSLCIGKWASRVSEDGKLEKLSVWLWLLSMSLGLMRHAKACSYFSHLTIQLHDLDARVLALAAT